MPWDGCRPEPGFSFVALCLRFELAWNWLFLNAGAFAVVDLRLALIQVSDSRTFLLFWG
jgi:hypothetical protein